MIVPAAFLKTTKRDGLGYAAFARLRYHNAADVAEQGESVGQRTDFVLNQLAYRDAPILVAGANFGCGSSREHAPWALGGLGIRCVIAPSFGDIFATNCVKNGMLPLALPEKAVDALLGDARERRPIEVDLQTQTVTRACGERISVGCVDLISWLSRRVTHCALCVYSDRCPVPS